MALAVFALEPDILSAQQREQITQHLKGCSLCRNMKRRFRSENDQDRLAIAKASLAR
jgi:predicted anti-sigma-YlaC factor YlaD